MKRSFGHAALPLAAVVVVAMYLATGCATGSGVASRSPAPPSQGPLPTSSPIMESEAPSLSPATASSPPALPMGQLVAGTTYSIPFGGSHLFVTVPADGWFTIDTWFLGKDNINEAGAPIADGWYDMALIPYPVANVYADPCHWKGSARAPRVGPTVDDLAAALVEQAGPDAIAPTDVTLGGYSGKKVELSIPDDVDTATCDEGDYGRWSPPGDPSWYGPFTYGKGQHDTVYIMDVEGTRWVIDTNYLPGTPEAGLSELEQLVASIRFEP